MRKAQKAQRIDALHDSFTHAASAVLLEFRGMSVAEMTELRRALRNQQVQFRVVKNTLAKRALKETGLTAVEGLFEGPTAVAVHPTDPVAPAKAITEFAKKSQFLKIKAGVVGNTAYGLKDLEELAKLPGRQEMLGRFAGTLQAPLQQFVGTFNGLLCQLVYAMQALHDKKAQG